MIEYRVIDPDEVDTVRAFCIKKAYNEVQLSWTCEGLTANRPQFLLAGEYVDGVLNGIMSSCSLGYLFQAREFAPIWVAFRVDRLDTVTPFTGFIHWIASLATDHFESRGYFQHYIVRRAKSSKDLAKLTEKSFVSGAYSAFLETVITSEDQLDMGPTMYKRMIGQFVEPVAIIHMVMRNEYRRKKVRSEVRTSICL